MSEIDDILLDVRNQLGAEFTSSDVVGLDGLPIASIKTDPNVDSTAIAARLAMVMKLSTKVSGKLNIGTVEDNLITTDKAFILVRFLGDGSYYWQVSVNKDATLGIVRMLMSEYAEQIWASIPH